jgi:hypothetical protein
MVKVTNMRYSSKARRSEFKMEVSVTGTDFTVTHPHKKPYHPFEYGGY